VVAGDLNCRRCGYNLRGLAYAGRCPECNTPVEVSAQSDALRFGDPIWLGRLCTGAQIVMANRLLYIAWSVLRLTTSSLLRAYWPFDFFNIILHGLALTGWWLLTSPDPGGLGEATYGRSREFSRVASLVSMGIALIWHIRRNSALPPMADLIAAVSVLGFGVIPVIGEVTRYRYLAGLADRIPNDAIAASARQFAIAMPIVAGFNLLTGIVSTIAMELRGKVTIPFGVLGCSALLSILLLVLMNLLTFNLLRRLHTKVRLQANLAVHAWAKHDSTQRS